MDFALNKEQELFRVSIKKYLSSVEKTKAARYQAIGDPTVANQAWDGIAELGGMAILVPEEYEGAGMSQTDLIPVMEEIGRCLLPGGYAETAAFAAPLIASHGTSVQKARYLPEIAAGTRRFALALPEPETIGNQRKGQGLRAAENGRQYRLTGTKSLVSEGGQADTFIVPAELGGKGLTLFLVDRDCPGVSVKDVEVLDPTKPAVEVNFDGTLLSGNCVIGPTGHGFEILQDGLLHLNAAISATMVGGMEETVAMATEYAKTREQFGQPIGRFQAVKHRIAEMKIDLELARSLMYYANWAVEHQTEDKEVAVAAARAFTAEAFIRNAGANIQLHGGIGFTTEIDCHLYLKRARSLENYLGTPREFYGQIQKGLGWMKNDRSVKSAALVQGRIANTVGSSGNSGGLNPKRKC